MQKMGRVLRTRNSYPYDPGRHPGQRLSCGLRGLKYNVGSWFLVPGSWFLVPGSYSGQHWYGIREITRL